MLSETDLNFSFCEFCLDFEAYISNRKYAISSDCRSTRTSAHFPGSLSHRLSEKKVLQSINIKLFRDYFGNNHARKM